MRKGRCPCCDIHHNMDALIVGGVAEVLRAAEASVTRRPWRVVQAPCPFNTMPHRHSHGFTETEGGGGGGCRGPPSKPWRGGRGLWSGLPPSWSFFLVSIKPWVQPLKQPPTPAIDVAPSPASSKPNTSSLPPSPSYPRHPIHKFPSYVNIEGGFDDPCGERCAYQLFTSFPFHGPQAHHQ